MDFLHRIITKITKILISELTKKPESERRKIKYMKIIWNTQMYIPWKRGEELGIRNLYLFFERDHGSDAHRPTLAHRKKLDLEKVTNEQRIICGYLRKKM